MLTLLGSLLGFLGSFAPHLLKFFQDGRDKAHELKMLELQALNAEKLREWDAKIMVVQSDAQIDMAQEQDLAARGKSDRIGFIGALTESVRPVITYWFFGLYAFIKVITLYFVLQTNGIQAVTDTPWLLWNEWDAVLLATIISYWFGDRTMRRLKK